MSPTGLIEKVSAIIRSSSERREAEQRRRERLREAALAADAAVTRLEKDINGTERSGSAHVAGAQKGGSGDSLIARYEFLSSLSRYVGDLRGCLRAKLKLVRRVERAREGLWREFARRRRVYWGDLSEIVLDAKAQSMVFIPSKFAKTSRNLKKKSREEKEGNGSGGGRVDIWPYERGIGEGGDKGNIGRSRVSSARWREQKGHLPCWKTAEDASYARTVLKRRKKRLKERKRRGKRSLTNDDSENSDSDSDNGSDGDERWWRDSMSAEVVRERREALWEVRASLRQAYTPAGVEMGASSASQPEADATEDAAQGDGVQEESDMLGWCDVYRMFGGGQMNLSTDENAFQSWLRLLGSSLGVPIPLSSRVSTASPEITRLLTVLPPFISTFVARSAMLLDCWEQQCKLTSSSSGNDDGNDSGSDGGSDSGSGSGVTASNGSGSGSVFTLAVTPEAEDAYVVLGNEVYPSPSDMGFSGKDGANEANNPSSGEVSGDIPEMKKASEQDNSSGNNSNGDNGSNRSSKSVLEKEEETRERQRMVSRNREWLSKLFEDEDFDAFRVNFGSRDMALRKAAGLVMANVSPPFRTLPAILKRFDRWRQSEWKRMNQAPKKGKPNDERKQERIEEKAKDRGDAALRETALSSAPNTYELAFASLSLPSIGAAFARLSLLGNGWEPLRSVGALQEDGRNVSGDEAPLSSAVWWDREQPWIGQLRSFQEGAITSREKREIASACLGLLPSNELSSLFFPFLFVCIPFSLSLSLSLSSFRFIERQLTSHFFSFSLLFPSNGALS